MSIQFAFLVAAIPFFIAAVVCAVLAVRFYIGEDIPAVKADLSGEMITPAAEKKGGLGKKDKRGSSDDKRKKEGKRAGKKHRDHGKADAKRKEQGVSALRGDDSSTSVQRGAGRSDEALRSEFGESGADAGFRVIRREIGVNSEGNIKVR